MGAGRYLLWAGAAATAYVGYKLTVRTLALLFLDEKPFHWVASITPPPDYDAAADLAPGKAFIAQHHPELLHLVEQGSLSVLERPPGYDRAFPDQLFLLGTAHVSRKTAEAVYDTILKVEPDAVVVELCRSRAFMMYREPTHPLNPRPPTPLPSPPSPPPTDLVSTAGTPPTSSHNPCVEQPTTAPEAVPEASGGKTAPSGTLPATSSCSSSSQEPDQSSRGSGGAEQRSRGIGGQGEGSGGGREVLVTDRGSAAPQGQGSSPSLAVQLAAVREALQAGQSLLEVLLGWAYLKIEAQLGTTIGLEFIRARHAIEQLNQQHGHCQLSEEVEVEEEQQEEQEQQEEEEEEEEQPQEQQEEEQQEGKHQQHGEQQVEPPALPLASGLEPVQVGCQLGGGGGGGGGELACPASLRQEPPVQVYYGDVAVKQTARRAWGVLSVRQRLRLAWSLLTDILQLDVDEQALDALLAEDVTQLLQREFGSTYPQMMGPLLHERNWHLAHTIHQAAQHGRRRVVLVVGRGHVAGVTYCLLHPFRMRQEVKAWKHEQQKRQQKQALQTVDGSTQMSV